MAQYADIVEIVAPSQATAGNTVSITVRIKNTYSGAMGVMVIGTLEYGVSPWPGIDFPEDYANVSGEATYSFSGSFTMPNSQVTIHAYSYWYGADGYWYYDDELTRSVDVTTVPEPSISEFRISDFVKV